MLRVPLPRRSHEVLARATKADGESNSTSKTSLLRVLVVPRRKKVYEAGGGGLPNERARKDANKVGGEVPSGR